MRARVAALCEVLGVYLAGQVVMFLLAKGLGVSLANPLTTLTADADGATLVSATHALVRLLGFQYALQLRRHVNHQRAVPRQRQRHPPARPNYHARPRASRPDLPAA